MTGSKIIERSQRTITGHPDRKSSARVIRQLPVEVLAQVLQAVLNLWLHFLGQPRRIAVPETVGSLLQLRPHL